MEQKLRQAHISLAELKDARNFLDKGENDFMASFLDKAIADAEAVVKTELTLLDDNTSQFTAAGCRYQVASSMSIARYTQFEEYGLAFGMSSPFRQVFDGLVELWNLLQKIKFGDMAVLLNKLISNVAKLDDKENYAFQVCTLFINREGEDVATWTPELAAAKIADWKAEALDARFFLRFASNSIPAFLESYKRLTQTTLLAESLAAGSNPLD